MNQKKLLSVSLFLITGVSILLHPSTQVGLTANVFETHISSSCTIFTVSVGDTVYFGNNEDYKHNNAYRWYIPAQNVSTQYFGIKEIYGAVFFGFDNNDNPDVDGWEQGGMNEYGLCYDGNGLPDVTLNLNVLASYPYTAHALAQVLWDCRNISEVISWYENHKWTGTFGGQIHYADSTGDAVVVGVNSTGQWSFTRIDDTFLVSTNFYLEDTSRGSYPCWRYEKTTEILSELSSEEELTIPLCADLLHQVHQEGTYATKYSNICDPVNLDIYFNCGENFTDNEKLNLLDKLAELDTFEEKDNFFGVTGVTSGLLVRTEQIDIQYPTNTEPADTNGFTIFLGIGAILFSVAIIHQKSRKQQ